MESLVAVVAAQVKHTPPIPAAAVGILSMSVLVFLLLITLAFRSVGSRHRQR